MTFISFLNGDFIAARKHRILATVAVVLVLVSLDLVVKVWAEHRLITPYSPKAPGSERVMVRTFPGDPNFYTDREIKVAGDYFTLTYVRNYNIGFSALRFLENWLSPQTVSGLMKVLQLTAVLAVGAYFFATGLKWWFPFTLFLCGGLGNVIDRLYRGYVVDYVKWAIPGSKIPLLDPWPVWNVADACVTAAIIAIIILFFFEPKAKPALKT